MMTDNQRLACSLIQGVKTVPLANAAFIEYLATGRQLLGARVFAHLAWALFVDGVLSWVESKPKKGAAT